MLVDDTRRALAEQNRRSDVYRAGKRFGELFDQRLAEAKRRDALLSEEQIDRLRTECAREAFGAVAVGAAPVPRPVGGGADRLCTSR